MSIFANHWCPRCAQAPRKRSLADFQKIAEQRGGRCLSREYQGRREPLTFICANGHRWESVAFSILNGAWCTHCHWDSLRGTIEEMQAVAAAKGGKCLSRRYVNSKTHLLWECHRGHQWRATPTHVKHRTWCPHCAIRERAEGGENKPKRKRRRLNES